eukprot:scaffold426680_cov31-Prasinocladus_malaysianus.AAC.3
MESVGAVPLVGHVGVGATAQQSEANISITAGNDLLHHFCARFVAAKYLVLLEFGVKSSAVCLQDQDAPRLEVLLLRLATLVRSRMRLDGRTINSSVPRGSSNNGNRSASRARCREVLLHCTIAPKLEDERAAEKASRKSVNGLQVLRTVWQRGPCCSKRSKQMARNDCGQNLVQEIKHNHADAV